MHPLTPLIHDLAMMLGVASIVTLLLQRIHQPVVLGYLVAGVIIGPFTPPHALVNDIPNIKILSELGVIFLMFSLGLEFSFHKLARVGFSAGITGVLEVILMALLGFSIGKILNWSFNDCLFLGAALSISSTTIIIKAIDELNLMKKRFAELIFGVLIVEDLLAILLLVALPTIIITKDVFSLDMVWVTGKLILVVGGWFIGGYFLIPTLLRKVMLYASEETITVVSVGLCLFLVSVAAQLHYSTALGAFIMGSILAETPIIHKIKTLIKPIQDIFAAVFFISIGMLMDPKLVMQQWPIVLFITLATILGKLLTTGIFAFLTGQSLNTALRVGFGMAQVGEFSFIIVGLGMALNATSSTLYPIIVSVSGITMFTNPYLISFSNYLAKEINTHLPNKVKYILEGYSIGVYHLLSKFSQEPLRKKIAIRLTVNSLVVAIIFTFFYRFLFPWISNFFTDLWLAKTLCWFGALLVSSPFLWGMLSSFKTSPTLKGKFYLNKGVFITSLFIIIEISILSFSYFHAWPVIISLAIFFILFFALFYKQLEKIYEWFEHQLARNIRNKGPYQTKYEELAPWDTYLVEIEVGEETGFSGKSIRDCQIRQNFGINIVAIQRDSKIIFAPNGKEKILVKDKLIILGNEDQIDIFRQNIEKIEKEYEPIELLENFSLKPLILKKESWLIGKTIRDSKIREKVQGMIVGLERKGRRILNPDPSMVLQKGDLLFLAGEAKHLDSLE